MAGAGGVNMEKFEEYFQRADLDRDGRISGAEAVSFLQGSNLPRQVLAQIWTHADQNRTGFLSRPEFYNALKLVTVAQSKRELTPDIVKAALYGPASAKIPAPQINIAATPVPQSNLVSASPLPQTGATAQPSPQNFGFRGVAPSSTSVNQQLALVPSTSGTNQQFAQVRPSSTMSQQFGLAQPTSTSLNQHSGLLSTGMSQQFGQVRPSSTMNQQFGQAQPTSGSINQQFGQLQPLGTGMNQQFGPVPSNTNMNQPFFPSQGNQLTRPPLSMPSGPTSRPPQAAGGPNISKSMVSPGLPNSNNDWFGGKTGSASTAPITQVLDRGASTSISPVASSPQDPLSTFSLTATKDPKGSGNGSISNPVVSGDVFSANQSSFLQVSSAQQHPASSLPTSSAIVPVTSSPQPSGKPDPFEALQSTLLKPSTGIQTAQRPSLPNSNQQAPIQVTPSVVSSGVQAAVGSPTSEQSQISWPKMTRAGIQKYAKVFMEVDTDRDGKITGEQARNLFLSWRLPREVLKQVWDLSDQDNDSMLSLREFCIALYLMERYREGRPLPSTLPNSVMLDETLLSLAGPPPGYGSMWGPTAGVRPQQGLPGARSVATAGLRPPVQQMVSQADGSMQLNQINDRGLALDNSQPGQPSNGETNSLDTSQEETNEKVDNKEKVLLDSREKLEFYRTKMQDLVLYKSRCDNRLNEITERARADKSEAEILEKKYQEKYKQVAEIHSKLTIEEASFREIQERKMELHQAITKMEQGGSADGILQVRADRIQSDLEELLKALTDRCKKHGVETKSAALIELPPGWHPGIPEVAAIWDEDWDKFEDEGFSFDVAVHTNANSASIQKENSSLTRSISPDSVSNAATSEKLFGAGASAFDAESVYSADESKSPQGSPGRQTSYESPSREDSENHFRKNSDGDAETHRSFDESAWGNFDNNDDIDSVWGFNAKDPDHGKHEEKYFFGSNDFGASSERSFSPHADSAFQKNSPFTFEDSVPGTPQSRTGNSPRYSVESRDAFFDNFSRYDSFSTHDRASSPRRENLTRFDSINSTRGFDHSSNYSFDDSDPFGSSGAFKVSAETPKKDSDKWSAF
ncbi:EH domain-containing protein 2 [Sesamum angolense]|uniref:EH domain-containing protein 2 n=1 Tax=Sesamum angolense TaxID=2727404 RepID=A0AAE1WBD3_9LAMI|nr:EH domain-containing protein 2 [Sesamum angolense]